MWGGFLDPVFTILQNDKPPEQRSYLPNSNQKYFGKYAESKLYGCCARLILTDEADGERDGEAEFSKASTLADTPMDIRLKWVEAITSNLPRKESDNFSSDIRDWNITLNPDGSVDNVAVNSSNLVEVEAEDTYMRDYPARFRLPKQVKNCLSSRSELIERKELFALGGLAYELISGKRLFDDLGNSADCEAILEKRIASGEFPEDVWAFPTALRILGCWCPDFARGALEAKLKIEKGMY